MYEYVFLYSFDKERTSTTSPYREISHHKICVVSSIDENDNLLLEIFVVNIN